MTEWMTVVILGVIEGITEFLPVSSTGHLLIAEQWLPYRESDAFLIVIQGGAVAAVLLIFRERLKQLLLGWRGSTARDYSLKLGAAFFITGLGGVGLNELDFRLPRNATPVGMALLVGGVLFLLVERRLRGRAVTETVTWSMATLMGLSQLVAAVFPGTSRSGATILIALAMGLSRPVAVEFSFLLGVPTLLAAGSLKLVSELREPGGSPMDWGLLALGTIVSAVTAFAAIRWLLRYVQSHTFEGFGWYRMALGVAVLLTALRSRG